MTVSKPTTDLTGQDRVFNQETPGAFESQVAAIPGAFSDLFDTASGSLNGRLPDTNSGNAWIADAGFIVKAGILESQVAYEYARIIGITPEMLYTVKVTPTAGAWAVWIFFLHDNTSNAQNGYRLYMNQNVMELKYTVNGVESSAIAGSNVGLNLDVENKIDIYRNGLGQIRVQLDDTEIINVFDNSITPGAYFSVGSIGNDGTLTFQEASVNDLPDDTPPSVVILIPDQTNTEGDTVSLDVNSNFDKGTGANGTWSSNNLPPGLTLGSNGIITGVVELGAESGSPYTSLIRYTTSAGVAEDTIQWTIQASTDVEPPTITEFSIPSTSNTTAVGVTFTATDNVGVTGYLLNETGQTPTLGDANWTSEAPTIYDFGSEGAKTLYGWARDAAGNISESAQANTTIDIPDQAEFVKNSEIYLADPSYGDQLTGDEIVRFAKDTTSGEDAAMTLKQLKQWLNS